jgi:gamma-glutamylcyclotransferase
VKYFIYSETLHPKQLKERAPEHVFLYRAYVPDHTLAFPRWSSQWRCGIASLVPAAGERAWGAVFEITQEDLKILDQYGDEVPAGSFRHSTINVCPEHEDDQLPQKEMATTHIAKPAGKFKPQDNYIDFVIAGLKQWKLPQECLDWWNDQRPSR